VGGGYLNDADGWYSVVAGGYDNWAYGDRAAVAGGEGDTAWSHFSLVGGGRGNRAGYQSLDTAATVVGGQGNTAYSKYTLVGGGRGNRIEWGGNDYAVIVGGRDNLIDAASSGSVIAGGSKVTLDEASTTFAFGDSFTTTTDNAVIFCHAGQTTKVGIGVTNPTHWIDVSGGAYCNGTNWVNASSRALKRDISELSADELRQVLAQLDQTQVVRYQYKSEKTGEEHIGVIAEDAPAVITTPERDGVNTGDAIGWLIAVAKAQQAEIEALKALLESRN
jgi:hypothetical protein